MIVLYQIVSWSTTTVIDGAVMLPTHADQFWNLGNLEVRKGIQDLIFPEGLYYSFTDGFGTVKLSESHLLIEKVTTNGDLNPNLVNHRTSQVETLFGELEYLEPRLKMLGVD